MSDRLRKGPLRRPPPRRVKGRRVLRYIVRRLLWLLVRADRDRRDHVLDLLPAPGGDTDTIAQRFAGKARDAELLAAGPDHSSGWTSRGTCSTCYFLKHALPRRPVRLAGARAVVHTAASRSSRIIFSGSPSRAQLALGAAVVWLAHRPPDRDARRRFARASLVDRAAMGFAVLGISMPGVLPRAARAVHLLVQTALAARHRLLPAAANTGSGRGSATSSCPGSCWPSCTRRSTRG